MPERKARIWSRSRSGCCATIGRTPRSGSVARARWIGSCSDTSNRAAVRASMRARTHRARPGREGGERRARQADQGADAAAGDHAVVDLQHVDRAREGEQVDHAAEQRDAAEAPGAGAQASAYGIVGFAVEHARPLLMWNMRLYSRSMSAILSLGRLYWILFSTLLASARGTRRETAARQPGHRHITLKLCRFFGFIFIEIWMNAPCRGRSSIGSQRVSDSFGVAQKICN